MSAHGITHGIVRNIEHGSCVLACPEHNRDNFGPRTSLWPYGLNLIGSTQSISQQDRHHLHDDSRGDSFKEEKAYLSPMKQDDMQSRRSRCNGS